MLLVGSGARRHHTVRCGASRVPRGGTVAQSSHEWHSTRKMAGRECPLVVKCYLWVDLMFQGNTRVRRSRITIICERETADHCGTARNATRPPWAVPLALGLASCGPRLALPAARWHAWPWPVRAVRPTPPPRPRLSHRVSVSRGLALERSPRWCRPPATAVP